MGPDGELQPSPSLAVGAPTDLYLYVCLNCVHHSPIRCANTSAVCRCSEIVATVCAFLILVCGSKFDNFVFVKFHDILGPDAPKFPGREFAKQCLCQLPEQLKKLRELGMIAPAGA